MDDFQDFGHGRQIDVPGTGIALLRGQMLEFREKGGRFGVWHTIRWELRKPGRRAMF